MLNQNQARLARVHEELRLGVARAIHSAQDYLLQPRVVHHYAGREIAVERYD